MRNTDVVVMRVLVPRLVLVLAAFLAAAGLLAPGASAQALRPAAASRPTLPLSVGEGQIMRLDHDAANVLVADPSIADVQVVSPRTLFVFGRRPGRTTLSATDSDNGTDAQIVLQVSRSPAAAQAALPPGAGAASFAFEGNRIVARGALSDLGQALDTTATARAYAGSETPLDRTRLAGAQQITLRVRIAEASRSVMDQLGVNLNAVANPGSFALRLITGSFLGAAAGTTNTGLTTNLSGQTSTSAFGQVGAGVVTGRVNANALLNALQSEGVVNTLAEPNLTTISGETAKFNAGGEVPIPVPQALGVTTIEYKQYGVQLAFTPVLLPGDRIAMRVQPQVSELSFANGISIAGTTVPAFVSRSADTSVEMASGQTLAIAGLYQRSEQTSLARFPFLGDVPVIGALFRSRSFQRDETELVILVTPYLSAPVSAQNAFPLPTDPAVSAQAASQAAQARAAQAGAAQAGAAQAGATQAGATEVGAGQPLPAPAGGGFVVD